MPAKKKPGYSLHKPSGQARCRINGRDVYLGVYGTPESRERYDDLIAEWFAKNGDVAGYSLTIDDLVLIYAEHVQEHYQKDGEPTSEVHCIRSALRHLVNVHGRTRARDFGPKALKDVRQAMIDAGYVRGSINTHVGRIRQLFRWAVAEELVPETVWRSLQAVAGLQKGRSKAKESPPVLPVPDDVVTATLPHLPRVVADMVRLQLLTGARPTELCMLRPCDVTRGIDGAWVYRPASHKTEHHGKERRIYIGPEGQELLKPYLDRDPEAYCFSPAESEAERTAGRKANRRSPMTPSQLARKPKGRTFRERYTKDSYNRAVARACEVAFGMPSELRDVRRTIAKLPEAKQTAEKERLHREAAEWRAIHCWSPNRLRHSRATAIREIYGIEAAQLVLGHSDPRITEVYAEKNFESAARIMREIG